MRISLNDKVPKKRDNNLGPLKQRWRFTTLASVLILFLLTGSTLPLTGWADTIDDSEIIDSQNNNTQIQSLGNIQEDDSQIHSNQDNVDNSLRRGTRGLLDDVICVVKDIFGSDCDGKVVTIVNKPPRVTLLSPTDEYAFQEPTNVKLSWTGSDPEGGPINYSVKVSVIGEGRNLNCELSSSAATSCIIPEGQLEFGKNYF